MRHSSKHTGALSIKLLIIIIAALTGGLLISSYWFLFKPGPEQVVQRYLRAYLKDDQATMQSLETKDSAGLMLQIPKFQTLDVGKAQRQGRTATVPVTIKGQGLPGITFGSLEKTIDVPVVKEESQWKVDLMAMLRRQPQPQPQPQYLPGGRGPIGP